MRRRIARRTWEVPVTRHTCESRPEHAKPRASQGVHARQPVHRSAPCRAHTGRTDGEGSGRRLGSGRPRARQSPASTAGHAGSGNRPIRDFKWDLCTGPTVSHFAKLGSRRPVAFASSGRTTRRGPGCVVMGTTRMSGSRSLIGSMETTSAGRGFGNAGNVTVQMSPRRILSTWPPA